MTWIVGKNISIATFPEGFFTDKASIGINSAAIACKTAMAFSCYPVCINDFLANGFTMSQIIGVKPNTRIPDQSGKPDWPNLFPGILNYPILYNNHTRIELKDIAAEINHLMTTNDATYAYHNNGTSLQLLLYWCVLHHRYPVRVCGCNQTLQCSAACAGGGCATCGVKRGDPNAVKLWAESHAYTMEVIRCMNIHGDIVRYYEDYKDCTEKENAYAKL